MNSKLYQSRSQLVVSGNLSHKIGSSYLPGFLLGAVELHRGGVDTPVEVADMVEIQIARVTELVVHI